MKSVGIIAEYNPLHKGHVYHLEEARRFAGADAVIVAMSGNFVQRGEPAILNKWERARLAVENGADIVIEIPVLFCLQSANVYASAGVSLLRACGISNLAFGSESGDSELIRSVADNLKEHHIEIEDGIKRYIRDGYSYPRARQMVYDSIFHNSAESQLLERPNDILAVEYAKSAPDIELTAVKRQGCDYNDDFDADKEYQSASGIRKHILSNEEYSDMVPESVYITIEKSVKMRTDDFFDALKYAVLSMSAEDIDNCPSGGEGIGNRIKSEIYNADSWDDLITAVKSKRYTYTRLSRLCAQILLGMRNIDTDAEPEYIRILALSDKGKQLLSEMNDSGCCTLPIVTNVGRQLKKLESSASDMLKMDIHASDIYNFVSGADENAASDYRMKPYIAE